ncbi:uncharacterized protein [Halyomorpha halys]|uniref:uncharacterized protein n=1 Tax=Halyomorpha halys TaxID=286706 RepID=UPI000D0C8E99|nr:uncharacterized protein LOC112210943 [Halyomorpha halys]
MISFTHFLIYAASCLVADVQSVVIQAVVDLDNDSENLLTALINKVDGYIDPKVIDSKNATQELAYALLRLGPVISVSGNITDEVRGFTLSFSLSAQADTLVKRSVAVVDDDEEQTNMEITGSEGGVLQPLVTVLEPYLVNAASIVFNGVMSNMIANFMHELSLLSSTNLC